MAARGSGYAFRYGAGTASPGIIRRDSGVDTLLGASISYTPANGDRVWVTAVGSDITVYRDTGSGFDAGVTRTDSTYVRTGYIAVGSTAVTIIDDFGGGNVSGPAPPAGLGAAVQPDFSKFPKPKLRTR